MSGVDWVSVGLLKLSWVGMVLRNVRVTLTQRETSDEVGAVGGWGMRPQLCSEVELRDRSLSARVRVLAVDAFAVAFHL